MIALRRSPVVAGWAAALGLVLMLLAAAPALAAPTFPPLTGRVVDDAHVLSAQTVQDLDTKLANLEAKTGHQLVVATIPDLQGVAIEDYGYQLGRAWQLGQKGKNDGAILIVAPKDHKVRIEVGYGLEPVLTDALSSVILQEQVLPKLRTGDYDGAVEGGTDALITQLSLDAPTAQAQAAQAAQVQSRPHGNPLGGIIALVVIFVVMSSLFRRHGGGGLGWFLPMMILGGSRGGWGGGEGGGGFGGGGGFSGGGGSFGGGGASGSW